MKREGRARPLLQRTMGVRRGRAWEEVAPVYSSCSSPFSGSSPARVGRRQLVVRTSSSSSRCTDVSHSYWSFSSVLFAGSRFGGIDISSESEPYNRDSEGMGPEGSTGRVRQLPLVFPSRLVAMLPREHGMESVDTALVRSARPGHRRSPEVVRFQPVYLVARGQARDLSHGLRASHLEKDSVACLFVHCYPTGPYHLDLLKQSPQRNAGRDVDNPVLERLPVPLVGHSW